MSKFVVLALCGVYLTIFAAVSAQEESNNTGDMFFSVNFIDECTRMVFDIISRFVNERQLDIRNLVAEITVRIKDANRAQIIIEIIRRCAVSGIITTDLEIQNLQNCIKKELQQRST
ncbi:uncharacterized protein [Chelonus insularis]|uniref:uncharacterized protein n=1 Tax=Chelonus insularis TaxID=460826 RepID=UPI00158C344A|nr:uncharacterized protein LOC118071623 [Chelonus insularis]